MFYPMQLTPQGVRLTVCNRTSHLSRNPTQVWHPACLIKEGGCLDLYMDTLHLKYPLIHFLSEGSALTITHFLFHPE